MKIENLKTRTCFFGHKWTKWEYQTIKIIKVIGGVPYDGVRGVQTRTCIRCGKLQVEHLP